MWRCSGSARAFFLKRKSAKHKSAMIKVDITIIVRPVSTMHTIKFKSAMVKRDSTMVKHDSTMVWQSIVLSCFLIVVSHCHHRTASLHHHTMVWSSCTIVWSASYLRPSTSYCHHQTVELLCIVFRTWANVLFSHFWESIIKKTPKTSINI